MGKQAQAISDEQIIAALLNNGTVKAAASAAGISERALYDTQDRNIRRTSRTYRIGIPSGRKRPEGERDA